MAYRISYKKQGFSLVELLIVIGIFMLIGNISYTVYTNTKSHYSIEIGSGSIVETLRVAQANAMHGKLDSNWGVFIGSEHITMFVGDSYNTRDSGQDVMLSLPPKLVLTGVNEIVFENITGIPSVSGTITLHNGETVMNILINEKGTLTY